MRFRQEHPNVQRSQGAHNRKEILNRMRPSDVSFQVPVVLQRGRKQPVTDCRYDSVSETADIRREQLGRDDPRDRNDTNNGE